jgi:hypothetical protein
MCLTAGEMGNLLEKRQGVGEYSTALRETKEAGARQAASRNCREGRSDGVGSLAAGLATSRPCAGTLVKGSWGRSRWASGTL